jgi:profilin
MVSLQGKEGFVITKTKQALILAHHPDTVQTQPCANVVQALGSYLIDLKY